MTVWAYAATAAAVAHEFPHVVRGTRIWASAFWGAEREPFPDADPSDEVTVGMGLTSRPMVFATGACSR